MMFGELATHNTAFSISRDANRPRSFGQAANTGRKSYNFPTSHHATRKTQTLTPTASNTLTTALLIRSNLPLPRS
jgi:hypothetical protein